MTEIENLEDCVLDSGYIYSEEDGKALRKFQKAFNRLPDFAKDFVVQKLKMEYEMTNETALKFVDGKLFVG